MTKYYTRACNFTYNFNTKTKKSNTIFIGNYKEISFDTIELISRKSKKTIKVKNIKKLNKKLKNKIFKDLKVEEDDQSSALGSMGLKPKIVH